MALNTKATFGYLNALNELPIVWVASENTYEMTNGITGEIFSCDNRKTLEYVRQHEIAMLEDLPYPNIPYGVKIGD